MKLVLYLRKGQLAFDFTRKPVQQPGSRGGHPHQTRTGEWRYGPQPTGREPTPAAEKPPPTGRNSQLSTEEQRARAERRKAAREKWEADKATIPPPEGVDPSLFHGEALDAVNRVPFGAKKWKLAVGGTTKDMFLLASLSRFVKDERLRRALGAVLENTYVFSLPAGQFGGRNAGAAQVVATTTEWKDPKTGERRDGIVVLSGQKPSEIARAIVHEAAHIMRERKGRPMGGGETDARWQNRGASNSLQMSGNEAAQWKTSPHEISAERFRRYVGSLAKAVVLYFRKSVIHAHTRIDPRTGKMEQVQEYQDKRIAAQPRLPMGRPVARPKPTAPPHRYMTIHEQGPDRPRQTVRIAPHPEKPGVWQVQAPQAPKPIDPKELCPQVGGCSDDQDLGGVTVPKDTAKVQEMLTRARRTVAGRLKGIGDTSEPPPFQNAAQSVDELLRDAQVAEPLLRKLVGAAAQAGAGEANFGPGGKFALKSPESLRRKVNDRVTGKGSDERTEVAAISDAVRGSVLVDSPDQLRKAAETLRQSVTAAGGKVYIDNKWEQDVPGGYAGVHADLLIPVGNSGRVIRSEVQLHLRSINDGTMESVKEKSHALYERVRRPGVEATQRTRALGASMLMYLAAMHPFMGAGS